MNIEIDVLDLSTGEVVPAPAIDGDIEYYWTTENLEHDPLSFGGADQKFSDPEAARAAGLTALNKMDEGVLQIWASQKGSHMSSCSWVLWEYRREKTGPSRTTEVPAD